jgi:hypothetical protein
VRLRRQSSAAFPADRQHSNDPIPIFQRRKVIAELRPLLELSRIVTVVSAEAPV